MHGRFVGFEVGTECEAGQERGQEGEIEDSTYLIGSREMGKKEQIFVEFQQTLDYFMESQRVRF